MTKKILLLLEIKNSEYLFSLYPKISILLYQIFLILADIFFKSSGGFWGTFIFKTIEFGITDIKLIKIEFLDNILKEHFLISVAATF